MTEQYTREQKIAEIRELWAIHHGESDVMFLLSEIDRLQQREQQEQSQAFWAREGLIAKLQLERDKAIEGLRWYADPAQYDIDHLDKHGYIIIDKDGGEKARAILSELGVKL